MPPSEQEQRCASAACRYLVDQATGKWQVAAWLDEGRDGERSPDVLLTDGANQIALEITQLTAGKRFDDYDNAQSSLHRRLAPDRVRNLTLIPPPTLEFPLDKALVRSLKAPIEAAAKDLPIGAWGSVLFPRRATVKYARRHFVNLVACLHAQSDHLKEPSRQVDGVYFLQDEGTPHHQFLTEERQQRFHEDLVRACRESKRASQAVIEWHEEWQLYRSEDSTDGRGGVLVTGAVFDFLEAAAIQSVDKAIGHAKEKFGTSTSSNSAAAAVDAGDQRGHIPLETFEWAINRLTAAEAAPIDVVFLVVGDEVRLCRHFAG